MDTILCTVDFSPVTQSVVSWAAMFARLLKAHLCIFHAIHTPTDPIHPTAEFERGGNLQQRRRQSNAKIQELMKGLDLSWRAEIVFGEPAEMVQQFCRQNTVGMIIAGSQGLRGIKRLLLGTVVERMVRMVPCPMLVLRQTSDASPGINKIGICCDPTDQTDQLVTQGLDLALKFDTELCLMHTMASAMDAAVVDPTDAPYGQVQQLLHSKLQDNLLAKIPDQTCKSVQITTRLIPGQPKEDLPALASELEIDLLIVGVRQQNAIGKWILGSTTEALLRRAACPVLTVPTMRDKSPILSTTPTGVVRDSRFLDHRNEGRHVESPRRLENIYTMLDGLNGSLPLKPLEARGASEEELVEIHSAAYVKQVAATANYPYSQITADTYASAQSFACAALAAGGVLSAIDAVINAIVPNVFVLARPPGHHAEAGRANGFCLFNNVALGARYARMVLGLEKVLIVDWDVHHGNGIQHIFEQDPTVLYFSTHQYPLFPGTGHYLEVGQGPGEGYTINVPLKKGFGNGDYAALYQKLLQPVALAFNPDLILVSAGFDIHKNDPMGKMRVTETGFAALTRIMMDLSKACCRDRLVLVLEGGYHLKALTASVRAVLAELCNQTHTDVNALAAAAKQRRINPIITRCRRVQNRFWPQLG